MGTMDQTLAVALFFVFDALIVIAAVVWLIWRHSQGRTWFRHVGLLVGIGITLLTALLFGIGMAMKWQGLELNACIEAGKCYCENFELLTHHLPIAQPVSTLTAFTPMISGMLILGWSDADRIAGKKNTNPMKVGGTYALLFGLIVLLLGPGSMIFHASMTEMLGRLDPLSIVLFASFVPLYGIWRASLADTTDWGLALFLFIFGVLVLLAAIFIFGFAVTDIVSMVAIGLLAAIEILLIVSRTWGGFNGLKRPFGYFFAILVAFGLAFFLWFASETGRSLCVTDSFWQGHGAWHILAMGVVPLLFFLHFRAEGRP